MPKKEDTAFRIASCRSSYIVFDYRFHCFELIMNLFQEFPSLLNFITFFYFFVLLPGCLLILELKKFWISLSNPWIYPDFWNGVESISFSFDTSSTDTVSKIPKQSHFQSVNIPNTKILTKNFPKLQVSRFSLPARSQSPMSKCALGPCSPSRRWNHDPAPQNSINFRCSNKKFLFPHKPFFFLVVRNRIRRKVSPLNMSFRLSQNRIHSWPILRTGFYSFLLIFIRFILKSRKVCKIFV